MELVRAVDWIADWSREAGRILVIIPFESSPEEMKSSVIEMCKACVACVTNLARCIKVLPDNPKEAIELANEVEMLEEDIDDLYSITRRHLANLDFPDFSPGALILLNEFLDSIETVADWCENSADLVRAIAVRIH
jgi:predicted phosphate transport protein (TIGR00153 family)